MTRVEIPLGSDRAEIKLPAQAEILKMPGITPLANPAMDLQHALREPIGTQRLDQMIKDKLGTNPKATAVVVISDNTRPVPYKGEEGILYPIIEKLLDRGIPAERIVVLVATGTHRGLSDSELRMMLDPRVFASGITIKNHDCRDKDNMEFLGTTKRKTKIYINSDYMRADIKILTGLVESHFMAGVSGGRKSVCPGLVGEESTHVFHGAPMLASENAKDLVLENNPCHEEALEVALKAGVDFLVNVTLDSKFQITGVFAGDLIKAHQAAVDHLQQSVTIPIKHEYDIVLTHAGYVGINHYQAAKAGVAAIPVVKQGGKMVMVANNTDQDPVGSHKYKTVLHLLKIVGPKRFVKLINSPDWTFVPEQWQVQMWARLFAKLPSENLVYFSPQLTESDYELIPAVNGNRFINEGITSSGPQAVSQILENALVRAVAELKEKGIKEPSIAFLADGPYGIPVKQGE